MTKYTWLEHLTGLTVIGVISLGAWGLFNLIMLPGNAQNINATISTLQSQGYENVKIKGNRFFGCSNEEYHNTPFIATAPNGTQVSGHGCAGIFFSATSIRFN